MVETNRIPGVIALGGKSRNLGQLDMFFLKPEAFSCCVDCCVDKLQNLSQHQVCQKNFFFFVVGFLLLEGWFDELIYKEIYRNGELFSA